MCLLAIHDESVFSASITSALRSGGLDPECCCDLQSMTGRAAARRYRIVALFLSQIDDRVIQSCKELRETDEMTLISVVTRDPCPTRLVEAFDAGVDDYIKHPCEPDEVVARIRALVRRMDARKAARMRAGDIVVDESRRKAYVDSRELCLTSREYALLHFFMVQVGEAVTRQAIRSTVWSPNEPVESNVIEVHVGRLRQKLGTAAAQLQTVRGVGYRLLPEVIRTAIPEDAPIPIQRASRDRVEVRTESGFHSVVTLAHASTVREGA